MDELSDNSCGEFTRFKVNKYVTYYYLLENHIKRKTFPLEKTYNVKVGSIRRHNEERPVVKLDVDFAGSLYREELFGIDDRTEMGTEVLLTRRIMSDMNVTVNPNIRIKAWNNALKDIIKQTLRSNIIISDPN